MAAIVILLLAGNSCRAQNVANEGASPVHGLAIRVYNYARVDSKSLSSAESVAGEVFRSTGVSLQWVDCPLSAATVSRYPACLSDAGTNEFVLRILPRTMAIKLGASSDALGFAQNCPQTERACESTIFYGRIEELATRGYRENQILGYAIAHEVAHLLIGPGHSEQGIMRHEWSRSDLQQISFGLEMNFSSAEGRKLQTAFRKRMAPIEPQQEADGRLQATNSRGQR